MTQRAQGTQGSAPPTFQRQAGDPCRLSPSPTQSSLVWPTHLQQLPVWRPQLTTSSCGSSPLPAGVGQHSSSEGEGAALVLGLSLTSPAATREGRGERAFCLQSLSVQNQANTGRAGLLSSQARLSVPAWIGSGESPPPLREADTPSSGMGVLVLLPHCGISGKSLIQVPYSPYSPSEKTFSMTSLFLLLLVQSCSTSLLTSGLAYLTHGPLGPCCSIPFPQ